MEEEVVVEEELEPERSNEEEEGEEEEEQVLVMELGPVVEARLPERLGFLILVESLLLYPLSPGDQLNRLSASWLKSFLGNSDKHSLYRGNLSIRETKGLGRQTNVVNERRIFSVVKYFVAF